MPSYSHKHGTLPISIVLDTFRVVFEPTVTEVWEDAGQVEMFKIVKQGETEQVVNVMLSCLEIGERINVKFMSHVTLLSFSWL